jgi:hypothetical protein
MLLIQLLLQHPLALGQVIQNTPTWVWGLLAALLALGYSQVATRQVSLARTAVVPLAMPALSLWGMANAFSHSPLFPFVVLAWCGCFALAAGLIAPRPPAAGTRFDAASRRFLVPGSWLPLGLFLGIFAVRYLVGADLALDPTLAQDGPYTLVVGALYGVFSGALVGRVARLWRLVLWPAKSKLSQPLTPA